MNISPKVLGSVAVLATMFTFGFSSLAMARTAVNYGSLGNFAVLAATTITNTGSTVISGDLGLSPGSSVTGFPPATLSGEQHVDDPASVKAKVNLTALYNDAAAQTPVTTIPTELGGTTITPGVYDSLSGTFEITGPLTLDAKGDSKAVFIFKCASTLVTASGSKVILVNRAQAANVFWQVGSSATLGTYSTFKGTLMALTSITATTGVKVQGHLFAQNAAVTLDTNTIVASNIPRFPETGLVNNLPWNIILPIAAVVVVALLVLFLARKKKTV